MRKIYVDTSKVNFNLACAIYAWETVSARNVVTSFEKTGVLPFDPVFLANSEHFAVLQQNKGKNSVIRGIIGTARCAH